MRDAFVLKHPPLITPRIEFRPAPPPDLPLLTMRSEYTQDHHRTTNPEAVGPAQAHSIQERRSSSEDDDQEPLVSMPEQSCTPALICEPPGQPGRPGSGGYCLEEVLRQTNGWTKTSIDRFNVSNFIRPLPAVAVTYYSTFTAEHCSSQSK